MIEGPNDGVYRLLFTREQNLTALRAAADEPLHLLPPEAHAEQRWQVTREETGTYTIRSAGSGLFVGFEGEPDMHETAILQTRSRSWHLVPGAEGDTYAIGVPATELRLGMSLLRIYPPRVALAPKFGDQYQAWAFQKAG